MRRFAFAVPALLGIVAGLIHADTLPVKTLTDVKDATAFIRIEKDRVAAASGSGFLIHTDGETGYAITNHHVVHLTTLVERKTAYIAPIAPIRPITPITPPRIVPGQPIKPIQPIRPGGGIEYKTEMAEVTVPLPNITLVFGAGGKNERSVKAEVVAADKDADLAVVKFTGLKDMPKPLSLKSPELVETLPVFVFGFPFGKSLALDKGNPNITVTRAAVSSLRNNKAGDVAIVQLDGDVNPGNSGGPVVDDKGNLVGVVFARIRDSKIGLAIPTQRVHRILTGRTETPKLIPLKADSGALEVQVEVDLVDPLERIKTVTVHYAPTSAVADPGRKDGIAGLAEAKKVELQREKNKAVGKFSVALPENGAFDLACQTAHLNAEGKVVLGELKTGALKAPAQVAAKTPDPQPNPPTTTPAPVRPQPPLRPQPKAEEKFDVAALEAALKQSGTGDRGKLVGATLPPLTRKPLAANDLNAIIADLQTPDKAAKAVGRLHNTEADPNRQAEVAKLLVGLAAKKDWDVFARASACTALRWWGTPESVEALSDLLSDGNVHSVHYRHPAMWSLAYLGGDKASAAIGTRLEDFIDRRSVVKMLEQMGSVAEPTGIQHLFHKAPEIRTEAAKILKTVGTKASAAPLLKIAETDANEEVRKHAREALQAIAARQEAK